MGTLLLSSCTISFQNISTHGVADDLIDEEKSASPDIDTSLPILPTKADMTELKHFVVVTNESALLYRF